MRFFIVGLLLLLAAGPVGAQPVPLAGQCIAAVSSGPPARWIDQAVPARGRVFAETSSILMPERAPLCIFTAPYLRDPEVRLRFQLRPGGGSSAAGIAVRVRDAGSYIVLRAEPNRLRLDQVEGGRATILGTRTDVVLAAGGWHELRLRVDGEQVLGWLDDRPMIEARAGRPGASGRMALWSLGDSRSLFEVPRLVPAR